MGCAGNPLAPREACPVVADDPSSQPLRDGRIGLLRNALTGMATLAGQPRPVAARCMRLPCCAGRPPLALQYPEGPSGTIKTECEHPHTIASKLPTSTMSGR